MQTNRFKLNADKTEVMIMSNKRSNPSSIALHPNEPEVDEADCLPQLTLRNLGCGKCCPQADQNKDKKAVDQGRGHDC